MTCPKCQVKLNRKIDAQFFLIVLIGIAVGLMVPPLKASQPFAWAVFIVLVLVFWLLDALTVKLVAVKGWKNWLKGYDF